MKWLVVGKDARLKEVAKMLSSDVREVHYHYTDAWTEELSALCMKEKHTHIVLPILPLDLQEKDVFIPQDAKIFAGRLTDAWREIVSKHDVVAYLKDEAFIWQNAKLTAYGLLAYLLEKGEVPSERTFVVTGFGRVAKMVAKVLSSLEAKIIVATRSELQQAEAHALGYESVPLYDGRMFQADFLVNTIPAPWLVTDAIAMPIIDVASKPGCLLHAENPPYHYELLAALPARYFPKQSAKLLYEAIERGGKLC